MLAKDLKNKKQVCLKAIYKYHQDKNIIYKELNYLTLNKNSNFPVYEEFFETN